MSLKSLQLNFLFWASRWVREGTEEKPINCDLPDVVCLLQSLGYRITKIETDTTNADLPKTTEITIVCNQSGQKCFLESQPEACECLKPDVDSSTKDSFWEITATNRSLSTSSLIETGTDLVQKIPKELNVLIRNVISYFVKVIRKKHAMSELLEEQRLKNRTSSPNENARELSDYVASMIELNNEKPDGAAFDSIKEQRTTPNRYKSLDTLLREEMSPSMITANPPINKNTKSNLSRSSPNIKLQPKVPLSLAEDSVKELNDMLDDIYYSVANAKKLAQTLKIKRTTLQVPKPNFEETASVAAKPLDLEQTKIKRSTSKITKIPSSPYVKKFGPLASGKGIPVLEKKDNLRGRKSDVTPTIVKTSPKPPSGRKSLDPRITMKKLP